MAEPGFVYKYLVTRNHIFCLIAQAPLLRYCLSCIEWLCAHRSAFQRNLKQWPEYMITNDQVLKNQQHKMRKCHQLKAPPSRAPRLSLQSSGLYKVFLIIAHLHNRLPDILQGKMRPFFCEAI